MRPALDRKSPIPPMKLFNPFRNPLEPVARRLYFALVEQSRTPAFYTDFGVPDTVDGRFEMLAMHAYLIMRRLKGEGEQADGLAQSVFDLMAGDLDRSLRDIGVSDLRVGKKVKELVSLFYGRVHAYDKGLSEGGDSLREALAGNLYSTVEVTDEVLDWMVAYIQRQEKTLATQSLGTLLEGKASFVSLQEIHKKDY